MAGPRVRSLKASDLYRIPALNTAGASSADGEICGLGLLDGCRVLLASADPVNRALTRAVLLPLAVELTEACDGREAVDAAMTAPFDVILIDLPMPGLDGFTAAHRIQTEDGPNIATPIIAFSADLTVAAGVGRLEGVIAKPPSPAALVAAIVKAADWLRPQDGVAVA